MSNFSKALSSLTIGLVGGLLYFISPFYGEDKSVKPVKEDFGLRTESVHEKGSDNKFSWQWNLDPKVNPEPNFIDYIMPLSICNTVTYHSEANLSQFGKVVSTDVVKAQIATQVKNATDYSKVPIKEPRNLIQNVPSCNNNASHRVKEAKIEIQAMASDENNDRGFESVFNPDQPNLQKAVSRDALILKAIESIKTYKSDIVTISKLPPEEVKFRDEYIKQLLEKNYPMGTDLERMEILSKINQSDSKIIKDQSLKNLIAQHRGYKVTTTKQIDTQQVVSIPTPVGLTPLLLLVPSVRIATFQSVRIVFTTGLFTVNAFSRLTLHLLSQVAQLSIYALRLVRVLIRKMLRLSKKNSINTAIWVKDSCTESLDNLAYQVRLTKARAYLINRKIKSINHYSEERLRVIYHSSLIVMNLSRDFSTTSGVDNPQFTKALTINLLSKGVLLAKQVQSEFIGMIIAQYISAQINVQDLQASVNSFLVSSSWNYHSTSRLFIDKSKNILYSILKFQSQFSDQINSYTQDLIRLTIDTLVYLVEALEIVLNSFRKDNTSKTSITHDLSSTNSENLSSLMIQKIMEDLNQGYREKMYQFKHNDQQIVLHVNYHPNDNLLIFEEPFDESMLSFSTDKFTVRAKILQ